MICQVRVMMVVVVVDIFVNIYVPLLHNTYWLHKVTAAICIQT